MKPSGIVRHMDELRRVAVPKVLCEKLGFDDGCAIEFFYSEKDKELVLKKYYLETELESENVK